MKIIEELFREELELWTVLAVTEDGMLFRACGGSREEALDRIRSADPEAA